MYKFFISGFAINECGEDMKKQARRASHYAAGCDESVELAMGPVKIKEKTGQEASRHLTRRELVFGMPGFAGLVSWRGRANGTGEVTVLGRAKLLRVDSWIIDFVRQIILQAGWQIIREENLLPSYKNLLKR